MRKQKFVLNYFKQELPEYVENVADERIILVDHNEKISNC